MPHIWNPSVQWECYFCFTDTFFLAANRRSAQEWGTITCFYLWLIPGTIVFGFSCYLNQLQAFNPRGRKVGLPAFFFDLSCYLVAASVTLLHVDDLFSLIEENATFTDTFFTGYEQVFNASERWYKSYNAFFCSSASVLVTPGRGTSLAT